MVEPAFPTDGIPDDVITQIQADMDTEQGLNVDSPPPPLTEERMREIIQSHMQPLQTQISGVQGLVDRGLNAIRRDSQADLGRLQESLQSAQERNVYLDSLSPDMRQVVEPLLKEVDAAKNQNQPVQTPVQQTVQDAQNQTVVSNQWEQVYKIAESFGLDRNAVDYGPLTNPALTEQQKQEAFFGNIRTAVIAQATTQGRQEVAVPQTQVQTPNETVTPPVETARAAPAGGHTTVDALADWYIQLPNPSQQQVDYYNRQMDALSQ